VRTGQVRCGPLPRPTHQRSRACHIRCPWWGEAIWLPACAVVHVATLPLVPWAAAGMPDCTPVTSSTRPPRCAAACNQATAPLPHSLISPLLPSRRPSHAPAPRGLGRPKPQAAMASSAANAAASPEGVATVGGTHAPAVDAVADGAGAAAVAGLSSLSSRGAQATPRGPAVVLPCPEIPPLAATQAAALSSCLTPHAWQPSPRQWACRAS
jgi:hypothetical protein